MASISGVPGKGEPADIDAILDHDSTPGSAPRRLHDQRPWFAIGMILAVGAGLRYWVDFTEWDTFSLDTQIYREAAVALLDGADVYAGKYGSIGGGLPFTYPPFALLVFALTALIPGWLANVVFLTISTVLLFLCIAWSIEYASGQSWRGWTGLCFALTAFVALTLEPFRTTFWLGQVNIALLALIMFFDMRGGDLRRRGIGDKFGGIGAGIGAAIKVTPAILVVGQLARGAWRPFAAGVLAFAACTAVALVLLPQATITYFTTLLWDSGRPGDLDYISNQSLRGAWERHLPAHSELLWMISVIAALVLGFIAIRRHRRDPWFSLTIAALVGLLVSPVSWNHHWVWALPAVAVAWRYREHSRVLVVGAGMIAFAAAFEQLIRFMSTHAPFLQDTYVVSALVWLVGAVLVAGRSSDQVRSGQARSGQARSGEVRSD